MILCFALLTVGCQTSRTPSRPIVYSGGDGASCEQAVIIGDVQCREAGTLAERLWLAERYPGHREASQSALSLAGRQYDVVEFATAGGETRKVYFDTTEIAHK